MKARPPDAVIVAADRVCGATCCSGCPLDKFVDGLPGWVCRNESKAAARRILRDYRTRPCHVKHTGMVIDSRKPGPRTARRESKGGKSGK